MNLLPFASPYMGARMVILSNANDTNRRKQMPHPIAAAALAAAAAAFLFTPPPL
eukprot:CAMPEP_0113711480 /NCGR_PEP_ID=MMETSP0038_2-20120614/30787_1 /TAXON_ID=2898 /ORGANISM="Cryptomonas paramecium" /LENGTH=53 /DNA_ID=CAMNT_0000637755 /DNA_START=193 /DNA_END=351 /DNA_ORIENTATION=+ /assembly_acc=CAM_ASM_000170